MIEDKFRKRLNFTISAIEAGEGNVSGVLIFTNGATVIFDKDNVEIQDSRGVKVFDMGLHTGLSFILLRRILGRLSCGIIDKVYPDCCLLPINR
ncbi:MAG: hypothetical protein ACI4SO_07485 [Muribaculaceae bacterium]